jgi:microcystin-dependent protein
VTQPYVGEIRMFAGNYAPNGWLFCEGQLLSIAENETLFQLIGTSYGGNGQTTFALPDLRGRLPVHQGNGVVVAQAGGVEQVTLTAPQIPAHTHAAHGSAQDAAQSAASGRTLARTKAINLYHVAAPNAAMAPPTIASAGGSQAHSNVQPYRCVHFIISLFGIFPAPS